MSLTVCSFVPAATAMIYRMGLDDMLTGVTFECPSDKPKVVRSYLEDNRHSSLEIERIVAQSKAEGKSLYYVDEPLLASLAPDIIFTQDVCDVCQIDTSYVQQAAYKLEKPPMLVPLIPRTLEEVYGNVVTIARTMGREKAAHALLASLRQRTDAIQETLRSAKAPLRRVLLLEWMEPLYSCGHWIPFQVAQAGGTDLLSSPGGYSVKLDWEQVRQYDPEVIVIAPCGLSIARASGEMDVLFARPGWQALQAVRYKEVYLVDSDLFTCPSHRLVDGIELLAALFHPSLFQAKMQDSYRAVL